MVRVALTLRHKDGMLSRMASKLVPDDDWGFEDEDREVTANEQELFELPGRQTRVRHVWLELEIGDGWRAAFRLVPHAGEPVIGEVRVFPADEWPERRKGQWRAHLLDIDAPSFLGVECRSKRDAAKFPMVGQGVTAQLLRRVPFRAVQNYARKFHDALDESLRNTFGPLEGRSYVSPEKPETFLGFRVNSATRRRTDAWSDHRYAEIAATYVDALENGSHRPVADVADRHKMSTTQARDAIHTARRRGLLTAAVKRGRAGGRLTPLARELQGDREPIDEEFNSNREQD